LPHLQQLLHKHDPSILCLQETWLNNNQRAKIKNFHCPIRRDREAGNRGGVSIHIRQDVPYEEIKIDNCHLEAVAVKLYFENCTMAVCSLYLPPNTENSSLSKELDALQASLPNPYVISADANAHHYVWGSDTADSRGKLINSWATQSNAYILNSGEPTFLSANGSYTHIDLTLCSHSIMGLEWEVEADTYHSDHFPIIICDRTASIAKELKEPTWSLKTADWLGYARDLNLNFEVTDPSKACQELTSRICMAAAKNIKKSPKYHCPNHTKSWWSDDCSKAVRDKNRAYNNYKKKLGDIQLWIEYKKMKAVARRVIVQAKKDSWKHFVSTMSTNTKSSQVWRKIRMLRSTPSPRPTLLEKNDLKVSNPRDIADILVDMYASRSDGISEDNIFTQHKNIYESEPLIIAHDNSSIMNRNFEWEELNRALSSCKTKSAGPDGFKSSKCLILSSTIS